MTTRYVDPINGDNTYAGDSFAAGHPWKNINKSLTAGDTILVAKSPEVAVTGTVTAGSYPTVSLTTSQDMTGTLAAGNFIRMTSGGNLDNAIYMIRTITATTITLYRPYRGTAESGKSIYKLTSASAASDEWQFTNAVNPANMIIQAGINTSNDAQDGYTVILGPGSGNGLGYSKSLSGWSISRLGVGEFANCWGFGTTWTNFTVTDCYSFKNVAGNFANVNLIGTTINGFVTENCVFDLNNSTNNSVLNDIETGNPGGIGMTIGYSTYHPRNAIINRWKNAGYASYAALSFVNTTNDVEEVILNDCIFDELGSGCINITPQGGYLYNDIIFNNPKLGSGAVINTSVSFVGRFRFNNIAGDPHDNRSYVGRAEVGKFTVVSSDYSNYHTTAPSAKVALSQSAYYHWERHFVPCFAGVAKTVSVYVQKNSSVGSGYMPQMRLTWFTGTSGNLTTNQYTVTAADNTNWQQLSHSVTPGVDGIITVDIMFYSPNSGAIMWYDDLVVA